MKIKNITLKNNLILAPMAGISDVAFRELCVRSGADYATTEMVSAKALLYGSKKTKDLLMTSDAETIKVVQLFGSEASVLARAVQLPILQKFDIIDLNMGCPAPKITGNGEGSALMKAIEQAKEIISACVQATDKPITVKFRLGWDEEHINAVEFAKMCERAGASAIAVHGRTQEQGYSGKANWEIIRQVKQAVSIPVIANGDVVGVQSYEQILQITGCDAVMIGRGSLGNPAIFSQLLGNQPIMSQLEFVKTHIKILRKYYPENFLVKHMRKHLLWYVKGIQGASGLKAKLSVTTDLDEAITLLEQVL